MTTTAIRVLTRSFRSVRAAVLLLLLSSGATAPVHAAPAVVERVDHVLIATKDLAKSKKLYSEIFGNEFSDIDPLALSAIGGTSSAIDAAGLRLVEVKSGIGAAFVQAVGEEAIGLAFKVSDLTAAVNAMKEQKVRLLARKDNTTRKEAVLDPADTQGVLIMFVEYVPEYYISSLAVLEYVSAPVVAQAGTVKPNMERIDHFIHYVRDLKAASDLFERLIKTQFPPLREGKLITIDGYGIELLMERILTGPDSKHDEVAKRNAAGWKGDIAFAHISVKVRDYAAAVKALEARGYKTFATNIKKTRKVAILTHENAADFEVIEYERLIHESAALELRERVMQGHKK